MLVGCLLDGYDALYFGNLAFNVVFNALLQRHHRHRTACAVSLKPNFHHAFLDGYKFNVSAVGLKLRSDVVDGLLYSFFKGFNHLTSLQFAEGAAIF